MSGDPGMTAEGEGHVLRLERLIPVARGKLWRCWTEPALLKPWFCPKPWMVTHAEMEVRAGGWSHVVMRGPAGEEAGHRGVYLEVVQDTRLVFTDAYVRAWVPSGKPFMTGTISFEDAPGGTRYVAEVSHWSAEDRAQHEAMGFHDGWGIATDQLAAFAGTLP